MKRALFALVPVLVLLGVAELGVRVLLLAQPSLRSAPLPAEKQGLYREDAELFWSHAPLIEQPYAGVRVMTNSLGLRSPEIEPKRPDEFRILSLGESTTFGTGVPGDLTYTALLAERLGELQEGREAAPGVITSINAGVSAYSSFQSLQYLEERGLALEPDLVIFYHEVNDYLPSTLRDSTNNEVGVMLTDPELYARRSGHSLSGLLSRSALVRFLQMQVARRRIAAFDAEGFENPLLSIGLPDIGLPGRLVRADDGGRARPGLREGALGRRVSEEERREILLRLLALGRERGFEVLLAHPAYRASTPHECVLTRVAAEQGALLLDAQPVLHPEGAPHGALFRDSFHPTPRGHARLAEALAVLVDAELLGGAVAGAGAGPLDAAAAAVESGAR